MEGETCCFPLNYGPMHPSSLQLLINQEAVKLEFPMLLVFIQHEPWNKTLVLSDLRVMSEKNVQFVTIVYSGL